MVSACRAIALAKAGASVVKYYLHYQECNGNSSYIGLQPLLLFKRSVA